MSVAEELPFGWDDGAFISPFVMTSSEDSEALARFVWERLLSLAASRPSLTDSPSAPPLPSPRTAHIALVDLGCGEGSALMNTLTYLTTLVTHGTSPFSGGTVTASITGIDLDETLISQAQQRCTTIATQTPAAPPCDDGDRAAVLHTTLRFESGDIRHFQMDDLFPLPPPGPTSLKESEVRGAVTGTPACAVHVIFVYLLPDALLQLRERLEMIVKERGWLLVSNRWPVPYLAEHLIETRSHLHIYQRRP